ncbi:transcriptional repressor general negative regulator of transcription subunit 4 [Vanrija albida]|uniref:Transcriptional repressor general negative regulator of transcription subunit 4 n=1 Tax=Vanrija albida TaxID=181172 RepID=A0ABR3PWH4_9TREE
MPTVHPLPVNPTTGQQPLASLRSAFGGSGTPVASSSSGSGGVNRETLKQLQDVAWSDDEDDPDCMVCAEPLDLSDQNFKPCHCGLQICQFCYHKLLRDDPRCPGCRTKYDKSAVVYTPVDLDEVRRVKEKKAKRAKVTKQLESMGRRHFLDTRIVMKNSVYVVGMKIPGSGSPEEAVSILRSNEYFGQYGKVARLFLRDRVSLNSVSPGPLPDSPSTTTGIYIVYVRREDAARAISSLDGIPAPQGPPGQVLHASYGVSRYCDAFLRGAKCDNPQCPNLHEWGGEGDAFNQNDLKVALTRPAEYDARQKQLQLQPPPLTQKSAWPKPSSTDDVDSSALPRTANWGMKVPGRSSAASPVAPVGSSRPTKIASTLIPLGRGSSAFPPPAPSPAPSAPTKKERKEKALGMVRGRSGSSSQGTSASAASPKKKSFSAAQLLTPAKAAAPVSAPSPPASPAATPAVTSPAPPPGLSAPPGIAPPPGLAPVVAATAAPALAQEPEPAPEAGPSTYASPPAPAPEPLAAEYPIHSPYPDFDDVFLSPDGRDWGFEFSLGMDEADIQRKIDESHNLGGFEPSPFDPLYEELPKLGIPLVSLMAIPRYDRPGPHVYTGPFSPFAPSSPEETSSMPTSSDEPSGTASSSSADADPAPRTASRFEFARRGSLASARGQSPFRSRDEWGARVPSANGFAQPEDMARAAAAAAAAAHGYHPALAQLNSHVAAAQAAAASESWSAGGSGGNGGDYAQSPYRANGGGGGGFGPGGGFNGGYDSPQRENVHYSPVSAGPHVPPGYESYAMGGPQSPQVYGGMGGYVQQRRF